MAPRYIHTFIQGGFDSFDVRASLPYQKNRLYGVSPDLPVPALLVTCPIREQKPKSLPKINKGPGKTVSRSCKDSVLGFDVYNRSVRVMRPAPQHTVDLVPPDRSDSTLEGFSKKSKSRLRFTAVNASADIQSQFCMTYADVWPVHGRECKRQLHLFLKRLRYDRPNIKYIWIGEFQTRGAPHFHFFSDLPVTAENHKMLADHWHKVAGVSQGKHAAVHIHSKNFIPWDMGNGSYLCKYLDKAHQKQIPEGFKGFGRWWGNSTTLTPKASHISTEEIDIFVSDSVSRDTGEIFTDSVPQFLVRTLVKYQKKQFNHNWSVKRSQTMTVLTGAEVFKQVLDYQERLSKERFNHVKTRQKKLESECDPNRFYKYDDGFNPESLCNGRE